MHYWMKNQIFFLMLILACLSVSFEAQQAVAEDEKAEVFVQLGHSEGINSVSFSPDGRYLASGSSDNTIKLWDVSNGQELQTFEGHSQPVNSISYSPDGRYLASGSRDGTVKLWDVSNGHELQTLGKQSENVGSLIYSFDGGYKVTGYSEYINSISFSPDGRYLASGSNNKTIKLWDVSSGRKVRTFEGHAGPVNATSFSPDGHYLASGSKDGTVKLWEVSGGNVRTLKGHSNSVYSVAFSPDGRYLSSGGSSDSRRRKNTIKLWDISSGREALIINEYISSVSSVVFSPDGGYLASGGVDKTIKLWDVSSGSEVRTLKGHLGGVQTITFSPDGRYLASGSSNRNESSVRLWDVSSGHEVRTLGGVSDSINSVKFSPDGHHLAIVSDDSTIKIWELSSGSKIKSLAGHTGPVNSISFSPDGSYLASGGRDKTVRFWDVFSGREVRILEGHSYPVTCVTFGPYGHYLASGSGDETIKLWDVSSGLEVRNSEGYSHGVNSISFSPDGRYLASESNNDIKLWDISSEQELRTLEDHNYGNHSVDFSPDGRYLATGSDDNYTIKLWDVFSGREVRVLKGHSSAVWSVVFSPSDHYLVSRSTNTIKLWDISSWSEVLTLRGHEFTSVSFSHDNNYLVTASRNVSTQLWDIQTGQEVAQFFSFKDDEWVVITPEGYYNASPNGAKYLNVRVGNKVYGADQFARRFYRPEMVKLALTGKSLPTTDTFETTAKKAAPDLQVISPKTGTTTVKDELEVKLSITDTGGGVGDIYLYINDTLVSTDTRDIKRKKSIQGTTFRVALIQGKNRIRAEVYNHDNSMRSDPAVVTVTSDYKADAPVLHVLAVGIDEFENESLQLRYAVADSDLFTRTIKKRSSPLFKKIKTTLLHTKEETTKKAITEAFESIRSGIKAGDHFIFYASTHGDISTLENNDSKYFLITSNVLFLDPENLLKDAITQDELVALVGSIPAQNKLIVLDTCHAGEAGRVIQVAMANKKLVYTRAMTSKNAMQLLKMASGSSVFTASQSVEEAIEGFKGHGLFTWTMVEGLNSKADMDKDNFVSLTELKKYVEGTVIIRSKEHFKRQQVPYINVGSLDFSLGKVQ